jgi:hypothetical protein
MIIKRAEALTLVRDTPLARRISLPVKVLRDAYTSHTGKSNAKKTKAELMEALTVELVERDEEESVTFWSESSDSDSDLDSIFDN